MIIKVKKLPSNFIQIHKFPINLDVRLSWRAKGILTYLVGKDDNWNANIEDIAKHAADGMASVKAGLKELKTLGYARNYRLRDDKGKVKDWVWEVCEIPIYKESPEVEIQLLGEKPITKGSYPEVEIQLQGIEGETKRRKSTLGQIQKKPTDKANHPKVDFLPGGKSTVTKKERTKKDKNTKKEGYKKIKRMVFNEKEKDEEKPPIPKEVKHAFFWLGSKVRKRSKLQYEQYVSDIRSFFPEGSNVGISGVFDYPRASQRLVELYRESQGGDGTPIQS